MKNRYKINDDGPDFEKKECENGNLKKIFKMKVELP